jgi:hypothetical protein
VLLVVLCDFCVCGFILVGGECGRGDGNLESDTANAAELVVFGVDGEGEMTVDSVPSCRVDRCGVCVEFYMGDEDGGEGGFRVRVAHSREHKVW